MATRRHRTRRKIDKSITAGHPAQRFQSKENKRDNQNTNRKSPSLGADGPNRSRLQQTAGLQQRVMASAISSLASRQYSEEQLRRRLTAKFGDSPEIDRSISLLKDKGYLNDRRLAESYAVHRTGLKPMGRARLARELAGKLLSREVIDSALSDVFQNVPEAELIDRAIEKRVRSKGVPVSPADRKKMFDFLARLGFEYELIRSKIRSLGTAGDPEEFVD